jgi:rhodanese-related sulfurtransferase
VSACKFFHILAVTLALSGYATWLEAVREPGTAAKDSGKTPMVGGILLYRLAEAEALWHDPATWFVDVRSSIDYAYGHIVGALELPEEEFDARFGSIRPQLEQAKTIIVYCGSRQCARSLRVAIRLRTEGLAQTQIYPAGWNEWFEHQLPIERTATR